MQPWQNIATDFCCGLVESKDTVSGETYNKIQDMFIQDAISDWIDPSLPGVDLPADDECILYKDANWGGDQISFRLGDQNDLED